MELPSKIKISLVVLVIVFSGMSAFTQVISNGTINASITTQNPFLDASSFFDLSVDPSSSGKGLVFPRTDLTLFSFKTDLLGYGSFPTAFDGMIVYNVGKGNTTITQGVKVTSVTPGFYYFSNPTANNIGNQTITGGQWVRMNDSNISSTPSGGTNPDPATSPVSAGDVFYNTNDKKNYYYNGTSWVSATGIPAGNSSPLNPSVGDSWYDTSASPGILKIYDGSGAPVVGWVPVGGGGTLADGSITDKLLQTTGGVALTLGSDGQVLTSAGNGQFKWSSSGAAPSGDHLPVPVPVAGSTFYEEDTDILWVSDGSDWVKLNGVAIGGTSPSGTGGLGETYYDTENHIYYVSDGDSWEVINNPISVDASMTGDGTATSPVGINKANIPLSDFASATNDISLGSNKITNLATPTNNTDAATKRYVDDAMGTVGEGDMLKTTYDKDDDGVVDVAATVANGVYTTRTVNGHDLSSDVTVSASDVGLGNVTNESKATMFASPTFTGTVVTPAIKIATGAGAGMILTSDAFGNATWSSAGNGGIMAPGTNTKGDILYYDGDNWTRLPIGHNGQVLTISRNVPMWCDNTDSADLSQLKWDDANGDDDGNNTNVLNAAVVSGKRILLKTGTLTIKGKIELNTSPHNSYYVSGCGESTRLQFVGENAGFYDKYGSQDGENYHTKFMGNFYMKGDGTNTAINFQSLCLRAVDLTIDGFEKGIYLNNGGYGSKFENCFLRNNIYGIYCDSLVTTLEFDKLYASVHNDYSGAAIYFHKPVEMVKIKGIIQANRAPAIWYGEKFNGDVDIECYFELNGDRNNNTDAIKNEAKAGRISYRNSKLPHNIISSGWENGKYNLGYDVLCDNSRLTVEANALNSLSLSNCLIDGGGGVSLEAVTKINGLTKFGSLYGGSGANGFGFRVPAIVKTGTYGLANKHPNPWSVDEAAVVATGGNRPEVLLDKGNKLGPYNSTSIRFVDMIDGDTGNNCVYFLYEGGTNTISAKPGEKIILSFFAKANKSGKVVANITGTTVMPIYRELNLTQEWRKFIFIGNNPTGGEINGWGYLFCKTPISNFTVNITGITIHENVPTDAALFSEILEGYLVY